MLMIFGIMPWHRKLRTGEFHCPECRQNTEFWERRRQEWAHIFWVPLIRLRNGDIYAQCRQCRTQFSPEQLGQRAANRGY
jgi:hypothetical protein